MNEPDETDWLAEIPEDHPIFPCRCVVIMTPEPMLYSAEDLTREFGDTDPLSFPEICL